jgi:hypothetical protein
MCMSLSLANAEIGLAALRTTTEENEAHRRIAAAQIASTFAQLKQEKLQLRMAPDDTATEIGCGDQRDRRRLAPRDHRRNPAADRSHRSCQGRDRLDRQEPRASGSQKWMAQR